MHGWPMGEGMTAVGVLAVLLVLGVTAWLAWGRGPWAALLLVATSLAFSAALFLPGGQVRGLLGDTLVAWLYAGAAQLPWSLGQISHFLGFAWMALLLWALRPDLRVLRVVAVLVLLAVLSEGVQGFLAWRDARWEDVGVNLMGAAVGLVLAALGTGLGRLIGRGNRRR